MSHTGRRKRLPYKISPLTGGKIIKEELHARILFQTAGYI
jgi:hypothetical protein